MYTRIVETHLKPGKKEEVVSRLTAEILPVLQSQPGFVDLIGLSDEHDPDRLLAISFRKTKQDAERYSRANFERVIDLIRASLMKSPTVQTYEVESSTTHRIAAGKAA